MTIYKLPLVALIAQTSYAYRITVFTKSKYIAGVIILVRAFLVLKLDSVYSSICSV